VTRYNVNGFVEELPQLPENRYYHACAAFPTTGAFVVSGGSDGSNLLSSVLTLLPGAEAWTPLASLPRTLFGAQASIVGGRLRVTGGYSGGSYRSEVLEYHPQPWNQWVTVGNLQAARLYHAALSVGPQLLPCLSSECPPLPPSQGHLCAAPVGKQDCHYENFIANSFGLTVNCCCGQCDIDMTCAPDSTTGSGLWQPMHSPLCPADGCGSEGVVTSPNYPGNYPNNLEKTETIQVEEGLIISLQFTAFDIESHSTCRYDHLTITDGDGTTLMEKSCGYYSLPADIRSRSNVVKLVFSTSPYGPRTGWSVSWSAVTPGSEG